MSDKVTEVYDAYYAHSFGRLVKTFISVSTNVLDVLEMACFC